MTIAPDALCFGERQDPAGKLKDAAYERFEALHRLTEGKTLQGKYVWDARRALDYLESRPEVDRSRLGMIGHSLGGQETLFTTAADPRIRAAASSCGFGSLRTLKRDRILHNFALFVPGLAERGDYGAVLALVAPRPFLVAARTRDPIFPVDGIEETVAAARKGYQARRAADRLGTFYEDGPHEFSPALREAAYAWLDRWLKVGVLEGIGRGETTWRSWRRRCSSSSSRASCARPSRARPDRGRISSTSSRMPACSARWPG